MSIKVSVIIPVYNAEKYITECIESLLNQTLKECEFIFINDGSKDDSSGIIERYKEVDRRVILINQENQGVSSARNKGLNVAVGEYVGFVDADDFIEKNMFKELYSSAKKNNCDVVISNFESKMDGHKIIIKYPFQKESVLNKDYIKNEIIPYLIKEENLNSVCNKIYKKKLIVEKKIRFPDQVALGEDGMFNIQFFCFSTSATYINYTGYFYREVIGSATRSFLERDYFQRALEIYSMVLPEVVTSKIDTEYLNRLKSIKLINSVMAYIFITTSSNIGFSKKYKQIKRMITNKCVKESLSPYYKDMYKELGRYERFIISMMEKNSILGLYFATTYSRFRNK